MKKFWESFHVRYNSKSNFQKFFPELLDRNEKPSTNLVSYPSKQDLKRAEFERLQELQLHREGDSLLRAAGTRNKEGAGWLNGNFEFFLLFSVLECLP